MILVKVRDYEISPEYIDTFLGIAKYIKEPLDTPKLFFNRTFYLQENAKQEMMEVLEDFLCKPQDETLFMEIGNKIGDLLNHLEQQQRIFTEEAYLPNKIGLYVIKADPYFDMY